MSEIHGEKDSINADKEMEEYFDIENQKEQYYARKSWFPGSKTNTNLMKVMYEVCKIIKQDTVKGKDNSVDTE